MKRSAWIWTALAFVLLLAAAIMILRYPSAPIHRPIEPMRSGLDLVER